MLKHTLVAALLTFGLAAPAVAQTQAQTPPVTGTGQKVARAARTARVAPNARRQAGVQALGDQGRAKLRADLKATRSKLQALRKNGASASSKERRQLKREVRSLRLKVGKLRRHRQ